MHETKYHKGAKLAEWKAFHKANPKIEDIDAFIIDVNGSTVGKRLPVSDAAKIFEDGVQYSASALIADGRGHGHDAGGFGKSDGDPDGTAKPMAGTLCMSPWTKRPTAQVLCSMLDIIHEKPIWFDPRVILADVVARCRDAGLHPVVACELEFYLIDPRREGDGRISIGALPGRTKPRRAANLSIDAVDDWSEFLSRVEDAAKKQGLPVCGVVAEYGIGQFEVNLRHVADPLLAADQAVLLKRLIKGVARSLDMEATFMAKPFVSQPGSGLHVHCSLVDERGRNRYGAKGGEQLLRHSVAGLQSMLFDSFALFAPNFNSYRRYLSLFVPTTRDWGSNNRSVAFRIPAQTGSARRIEHRVAGADASPHLTVAAILAGILHGVERKLEPTAPVEGRASYGKDPDFPNHISAALRRLEISTLLPKYLPERYLHLYADGKRSEYLEFIEEVFPREYDFYV